MNETPTLPEELPTNQKHSWMWTPSGEDPGGRKGRWFCTTCGATVASAAASRLCTHYARHVKTRLGDDEQAHRDKNRARAQAALEELDKMVVRG